MLFCICSPFVLTIGRVLSRPVRSGGPRPSPKRTHFMPFMHNACTLDQKFPPLGLWMALRCLHRTLPALRQLGAVVSKTHPRRSTGAAAAERTVFSTPSLLQDQVLTRLQRENASGVTLLSCCHFVPGISMCSSWTPPHVGLNRAPPLPERQSRSQPNLHEFMS